MMITTDKVTVNKGDKVWRIDGNEIEQGIITHTDDNWTQVQWPNENYHKSFESYGHLNHMVIGMIKTVIRLLR